MLTFVLDRIANSPNADLLGNRLLVVKWDESNIIIGTIEKTISEKIRILLKNLTLLFYLLLPHDKIELNKKDYNRRNKN